MPIKTSKKHEYTRTTNGLHGIPDLFVSFIDLSDNFSRPVTSKGNLECLVVDKLVHVKLLEGVKRIVHCK